MPQFDLSPDPRNLRVGKINKYGFHYYSSKENTKEFLTRVLDRLKTEVGSYISFLETYNREHPNQMIGFFSLPRLLFPEIEAIGKMLYPNDEKNLVLELGIEYPRVVLQLYRNSLIHQSSPSTLQVGYTRISWSIGLKNLDHWLKSYEEQGLIYLSSDGRRYDHNFTYYIDMVKLYHSLVSFCEKVLESTDGYKKNILVPFVAKIPVTIMGKKNGKQKLLLKEVEDILKFDYI